MYHNRITNKLIEPIHTEHGINFITLYFKHLQEANEYSQRLYKKFNRIKFEHIEIQREDFKHLPEDPEYFHSDGHAKDYWKYFRHFHIIYSNKPTLEDWEYLYTHCNDIELKIKLERYLPTRYVQEK